MPFIPTVTSEVGARTGRTSGVVPGTRASPFDFGADIGGALNELSGDLSAASQDFKDTANLKQKETVANAVAQSDFTPHELEIRNQTPPDGEGYAENVLSRYDQFVEEKADEIEDDKARQQFRIGMLSQRKQISENAYQYQYSTAATFSKEQANASVMSLTNKIATDPTMYDTYVQQGNDVIDTRTDIVPTVREGMKDKWRQDAVKARFLGMMETATSVTDIDNIASELTGTGVESAGPDERPRDWAKEFNPADFETLVNQMGTARKAFVTKADTDARAALDTLEARSNDATTLISREELAAVSETVKASENPITLMRMARIQRDQSVIREGLLSTPAEIQGRINATNGNPGVAFPGVPPVVSSAINAASDKFGISASYLGGTVNQEYGQYLKVKPSGDQKFAPQSMNANADLRNVRPDVVDAATVAGGLFGAPLQIISGYRSQERQDAIRAGRDTPSVAKHSQHTEGDALDISTVGMSEEDKGKLAASLVDAGFTGIGEYDTHIHADFRDTVPKTFDTRDGKTWGGWTFLSPSVAKALIDRGFAPGLSSQQVARAAPAPTADTIDYGRGTNVLKDDDRPASSATGIMQFTEDTFLGVMKTPGMAAQIGVDITGMSDAQILELRKNPQVSIMAGAALAAQNKRALTATLGREVSDAELYMAHLLGAGGAAVLIKGVDNNPQQLASTLLPKAFASNKQLFTRDRRSISVRELYGRIAGKFATEPTQITYGDNATRQKQLDNMRKELDNNPMGFAQSTGKFGVSDLSQEGGFAQRGEEARSVADYYSIPQMDMKPFTVDETASLTKRMKEGSADEALQVLAGVNDMGGDIARGGLKQLGMTDPVYAYAGGLMAERGQGGVAGDIVRGQKRIEENKSIKDGLGEQRDQNDAFIKATGGALFEIDPRDRQAIQDAALAHYIETFIARSGGTGFDQTAYTNSVQAVMGGVQGSPAVASVNGVPTVLPPGVTGGSMEMALDRMTLDDWTRLSDQRLPPRYVTGDVITPADMADDASLRTIGGGKYRVVLSDGSLAITGRAGPNGRLEAYIFSPEADDINEIAGRPLEEDKPFASRSDIVGPDDQISGQEEQRLRERFGPLYQFDDNGHWLGPVNK